FGGELELGGEVDVGEVDELAQAHDTAIVARWASSSAKLWRQPSSVAPVTCAGSHWRTSRRVRPLGSSWNSNRNRVSNVSKPPGRGPPTPPPPPRTGPPAHPGGG